MKTDEKLENFLRFSKIEEFLVNASNLSDFAINNDFWSEEFIEEFFNYFRLYGNIEIELRKLKKPNSGTLFSLKYDPDRKEWSFGFFDFCKFPSGKKMKELKFDKLNFKLVDASLIEDNFSRMQSPNDICLFNPKEFFDLFILKWHNIVYKISHQFYVKKSSDSRIADLLEKSSNSYKYQGKEKK